jgi:hypothetical protein
MPYDAPALHLKKSGAHGENNMQLFIAFAFLAFIWLVVLWGSRYFGPQTD